MARTTTLRRQHGELIEIAGNLAQTLDVEALSKDGNPAGDCLARLVGKLQVHLAMEDKVLYPSLLRHADPEIKELGQRFVDELGPLGTAVKAFVDKWCGAIPIQLDAAGFVEESEALLGALGDRIEREDTELYDVVDALF